MLRFEKHASQTRVVVLASHRSVRDVAVTSSRSTFRHFRRQTSTERIFSTLRSKERALPRSRAGPGRESPDAAPS
jgi:hypothetical protein